MSNFINDETARIKRRIDHLQKYADEHAQLHILLKAIEGPPPVNSVVKNVPGRPATRANQVVNLLSDKSPRTAAEIARELSLGSSQVYTLLSNMTSRRKLVKNANKTYTVPGIQMTPVGLARERDPKTGRFLPAV